MHVSLELSKQNKRGERKVNRIILHFLFTFKIFLFLFLHSSAVFIVGTRTLPFSMPLTSIMTARVKMTTEGIYSNRGLAVLAPATMQSRDLPFLSHTFCSKPVQARENSKKKFQFHAIVKDT